MGRPLRPAAFLAGLAASASGSEAPLGAVVPKMFLEDLRAKVHTSWAFVASEDASPAELAAALAFVPDYEQLMNSSKMSSMLQRLPHGRLLQVPMTGYETVDLDSIADPWTVCNVHSAAVSIPEFVMASVMSWNVQLPQLDAEYRRCTWHAGPSTCVRPGMHRQTSGQTLGVIGYGTIGQGVAQRAAAMGMRVVAVTFNAPAVAPPPLAWIGNDTRLPELMAQSHFVVVSVPLSPDTAGMVDEEQFRHMRPDGVLINIGRGPIVKEQALFDALSSRSIGGAVLDVWWNQAPDKWPSNFNFSALPNVWMTPHTSFNTAEAHALSMTQAALNFDLLAEGKPLQNVIRPPRRAAEALVNSAAFAI